jgi:hypothetical protein
VSALFIAFALWFFGMGVACGWMLSELRDIDRRAL